MAVTFNLSIGSWSADSASDPHTEVVSIETASALGAAATRCRITLYAAPSNGKQLSFQQGDPITVELTAGDVTETVMTAAVKQVRSTLGTMVVTGRGTLEALATARVNAVYSNQTAQQIANDLASQASADVGDMDTGDTYPYFVAHESRSTLDLLRQIAGVEGMDLYASADGKLTMKRFTKQTADHTFKYGVDILDARIEERDPPTVHAIVAGESPASTQGNDAWYFLAKDASAFLGDSGSGVQLLATHDGAVRTKAAAKRLADATVAGIAAYTTAGRVVVLGAPAVKLGDAIAITDAPAPPLNATFKVTVVRHRFAKRSGLVTIIDFCALSTTAGLGGML
jgi:prophage tail gpP-like protein